MKHSRIKEESAVITDWKVIGMWYAQETHRYMDEGVLYDIRNVRGLPLLSSLDTDAFTVDSCRANTALPLGRFRQGEG